jgi:NAD(P)-dependent dehydrogenase (short-subunit alcohol dehydrogenase family)
MYLAGKRIVVLGGSSGIGLAVAKAAALGGGDVVIVSSNKKRVEQAAASIENGNAFVVDLTDESEIEAFFAGVGPFDHLVFTAGETLQIGPLADTELRTARDFFNLRYWGAFMAAKYGHPHIRTGGSIVFTSGLASERPHPGWALGASICAAMEGLTRALAVELAPVRVNIVSPGVVKTPLWQKMPEAERTALYRDSAAKLPVGHVGEVEEIAEAYLYAMRQSYATGEVIGVNGGGALV